MGGRRREELQVSSKMFNALWEKVKEEAHPLLTEKHRLL